MPTPTARRITLWAVAAVLSTLARAALAAPAGEVAGAEWEALPLRGWTALRAMDCARCHGRDYRGWSAPDLIAAVREGSRERFEHSVLEGEIVRGMPGYKDQALVVAELDAIYAYLRARADGVIGVGKPPRLPMASP